MTEVSAHDGGVSHRVPHDGGVSHRVPGCTRGTRGCHSPCTAGVSVTLYRRWCETAELRTSKRIQCVLDLGLDLIEGYRGPVMYFHFECFELTPIRLDDAHHRPSRGNMFPAFPERHPANKCEVSDHDSGRAIATASAVDKNFSEIFPSRFDKWKARLECAS